MKKTNSNALFVAKILRKLRLKTVSRYFNMRRHKRITTTLSEIFEETNKSTPIDNSKRLDRDRNIYVWVFWWQGEDQMPELVKKCYQSLKRQLYDKKIVLITKDNIKEYCSFPQYIFDKCESGKITLTHLSDILRFDLLSHYGGLYTDATVFWTRNIPSLTFSKLYTCGGYPDVYYFNVAKGRWTGFLIGGDKDNPLFTFMYGFFLKYWEQYDELIDYFLIDYALDFAYEKNIGGFKDYADKEAVYNNPKLFELMEVRNKKFTMEGEKAMMSKTCAFKLSYKKNFSSAKNTYANQIIFKK